MEGSKRPRRALGPVPDDWNEPSDSTSATPAGPLFDDPELTDTGMMRRLALNADGSLQNLSAPPPRPVLPQSEVQPASAGRRFSANDVPFDSDWVAPRRSAASVASPPTYDRLLPPVSRPTAPPPVTVPYQPVSVQVSDLRAAQSPVGTPPTPDTANDATATDQPSAAQTRAEARAQAQAAKAAAKAAAAEAKADQAREKAQAKADAKAAKAEAKAAKSGPARAAAPQVDVVSRLGAPSPSAPISPVPPAPTNAPRSRAAETSAEPRQRSVRPALIVISAVVVFALLVAIGVMVLTNRADSSSGGVGTSAIDPLLTTTNLSALADGPWQETPVSAGPVCFSAVTTAATDRTSSRKLATANNDSLLQVATTYADEAAATKAYNEDLVTAGTCADGAALVLSASNVNGLADAAQAIELKVQATKEEDHLLLVARTGRIVNIFDIVTKKTLPVTTAAQVAATSLSLQCEGGTCPGTVAVAATVPAAGNPAGWLIPADLPRITAGVGKWTSPNPGPVNSTGSQCEGVELAQVSGTNAAGQRSLLLTGDAKAPQYFGVDQVTYTFADAKSAAALAAKLTKSINGCAKRVLTASVNDGSKVTGVGQNGATITGKTWKITHKTTVSTFVFRVTVVTSGPKVTYLLANPSKSFDFSDDAWQEISLRAAQRASQAS